MQSRFLSRRFGFAKRVHCQASVLAFAALIAVFSTMSARAQDEPSELEYARLATAIDRLEGQLASLRGQIDQTRLDPEELVFELGFDPEEIVAFVRDEIVFHPYEGLLRGMRGTLMNRAGNSLDQALLLAFMLKSSGFDARIVRGEIGADSVAELLARTAAAPPPGDLSGMAAAIRSEFGPEALETLQSADDIDWAETELADRARQTAATLLEQLKSAELEVADAAPLDESLLASLRQYFWVEYRTGPGDPWLAAHPAFAEAVPEVTALEYMADQVDEKYQHKLTFSAWIRSRVGTRVEEHRLMRPWTRPSANLHGVTLAWRNHPSGLTPQTLTNLEEALDEGQIFTPVFNGAPAPGNTAFDLKGRTVDPMALGQGSFGAAGLFAELSNKMESAAGEVGDRPDDQPLLALEAMWIEFTMTTPSGRETRHRRYLLAPGNENMTPAEKLWPLLSEQVYLVNTGRMPPRYMAERFLAAGEASMGVYKALAHKLLEPDEGTPLPDGDVPQDFGPMALYELMDVNPMAAEGVITVRHQPAIVGMRNGLKGVDTAFASVDVVDNRMLHLVHGEDGLKHAPVAALRRGVWETGIETVPGRMRDPEATSMLNTFEVFRRARDQGIKISVIAPATGEALAAATSDLDPRIRIVVEHDLESGYAVIVPATRPEGVSMTGWWRVDPASGTTLGMTADGFGQDVVEYLIEVTGIAFNMVQALGGLMKCDELTDNVQKMCCLVEAHINNVAGLGFGSLMGATVGSAGAALFDIVNFGMTEATGAAFGAENAKGLMPTLDLSCKKMQGTAW